MVCDNGVRQSGHCMEAADGVPSAAVEGTLSLNGEGPAHCPICKAFVSPGEPCKRCMHLNRTRRTDTREAVQAGAQMGFDDPLNNPVAERIYSRYASVVTRQDRRVSLRSGGGFSTDLQGQINVDPHPLGPDGALEDQIIATWGGIEHELAHEAWSPRGILHAAGRIARGQTDHKYSGFSGEDLSEGARRQIKSWLNIIEDGRVERLLQENVPGAFKRVRAQDILSSRWDERVGKGVPVYYEVVGASLYDALPNFAVQRETYKAMSPDARRIFDRIRPTIQEGVTSDAAGALKAAGKILKVLDEEGIFKQRQQVPSNVQVHDYTGSDDADGKSAPSESASMPVPVNAKPSKSSDEEGDQQGEEGGQGAQGKPQHCPRCGAFVDKHGNCTNCDWKAPQGQDSQGGEGGGEADGDDDSEGSPGKGGGGESQDDGSEEGEGQGGGDAAGDEGDSDPSGGLGTGSGDDESDTGTDAGSSGGAGDDEGTESGDADATESDNAGTESGDADAGDDAGGESGDAGTGEGSAGEGSAGAGSGEESGAEGADGTDEDASGGSDHAGGNSTQGGGDSSQSSGGESPPPGEAGQQGEESGDSLDDTGGDENLDNLEDFPEYSDDDLEDVQSEVEDVLDALRDEAARTYANAVRDYAEETSRRDAQKIHDGSASTVDVQFAEGERTQLSIRNGERYDPGEGRLQAVQDFRQTYAGAARRFSRELQTIKSDVRADKPFQRRGRFDRRRMKAAVKGDDRVYYKRGTDLDQDIAVAIQVDRSGSMMGARIAEAVKAATITSMALEQSDIPYEIRSFRGHNSGEHVLHKDFASPKAKDEDLAEMLSVNGSTPMKRAVEVTRASLSVREEGIKLAFILADGAPNGYYNDSEGDGFGYITPVRKTFDAMEEKGITPVLVFTASDEIDSYARESLDKLAGRGRWVHVRSPASLHRIVSDRIRDIYRNAERSRG